MHDKKEPKSISTNQMLYFDAIAPIRISVCECVCVGCVLYMWYSDRFTSGTRNISLQQNIFYASLIYFLLCTASRLLPFLHRLHSVRQKRLTRQRSMTWASLVATCAPGRILSFADFLIHHMMRMSLSSALFLTEAMTRRACPAFEVNCPCDLVVGYIET